MPVRLAFPLFVHLDAGLVDLHKHIRNTAELIVLLQVVLGY